MIAMIEKPARGEVCATPRFSSTQLQVCFRVAPGDSCGFGMGFGQQRILPLQIFFSQSCNDSVCFGAMVFFSPFLWISPSSSSKNLWRCSSQIWYCHGKILLNIELASIWKSTSPPKDPNHSNSMPLQISQVWPDCSEFQIRASPASQTKARKKTTGNWR